MLATDQSRFIAYQLEISEWLSSKAEKAWAFAHDLRRRFRLHRMQRLDDRMLDDIGVTREELEWAIGLPLRVNAAIALHDRALQRRAIESAGRNRRH